MDKFAIFDNFTNPYRQKGSSSVDCAGAIAQDQNGKTSSFEDVVEAFSAAGFPPLDTLKASIEFSYLVGGKEKVVATIILMKKLNYPETEIEDALTMYFTKNEIKQLL
ncbi:hypothetical protein [Anaerorhabdus furcosa]|uniref:Uncharacterized protein n=1 Tax=Anaerorhabdus furcosa TaxID=118967 RepID=A0A1T4NBJ9_9FIRM|nr:hypothetical protein [Anaerorhabdus furcosa]SJZ76614.1 hypothetical protein SAMN02745191_1563 [Anaerorhabdus furcosa]